MALLTGENCTDLGKFALLRGKMACWVVGKVTALEEITADRWVSKCRWGKGTRGAPTLHSREVGGTEAW